ncbi:hypothetical protein BN2476_1440011 [Paraburkholderia piptadeniae]|uniref:Uncharacterized protein n=1 Tax=Paraburkholderia piptadeniae TaxID=1701573 RepID=A0A1N7SWT7_9BURK|nr:hypothetical protein [Paraburkholderia piptadeniae]SIT51816.1 hypothetical protein BN2476_1440011 [Paraburkholderia piptadeniae]
MKKRTARAFDRRGAPGEFGRPDGTYHSQRFDVRVIWLGATWDATGSANTHPLPCESQTGAYVGMMHIF